MTILEEKTKKKTTLKAMLKDKASRAVLNKTTAGMAVNMALALGATLGNSKAQEFSGKVSDLISSDDFISDLSDRIGTPLASETEDEFVARAKSQMRSLLSEKLE